MKRDAWLVVVAAIAVLGVANGIWMLLDPGHWYEHLPAGVPDTGPLNSHFVRDIGCAFLATGIGLLWAVRAPRFRTPLVGVVALFYVAHAILHVHDTARGILGTDHWLLDLPGVYLPAVLLVIAAFRWRPPAPA